MPGEQTEPVRNRSRRAAGRKTRAGRTSPRSSLVLFRFSWFPLPGGIPPHKRKLDARTPFERNCLEHRVHRIIANRHMNRCRHTALILHPFDFNLIGPQVRDYRLLLRRPRIAINHHVENGGASFFKVGIARPSIGTHGRIPASVAHRRHQLVVDVKRISELEGPGETGNHHSSADRELNDRVATFISHSVSLTGFDAAAACAGTVKLFGPPTARKKVISTVLSGAVTRACVMLEASPGSFSHFEPSALNSTTTPLNSCVPKFQRMGT